MILTHQTDNTIKLEIQFKNHKQIPVGRKAQTNATIIPWRQINVNNEQFLADKDLLYSLAYFTHILLMICMEITVGRN